MSLAWLAVFIHSRNKMNETKKKSTAEMNNGDTERPQ